MKNRAYEIIQQEEDYVVILKYPGVLSVPGRSNEEKNIKGLLSRDLDQQVLPVHRLDRDTSGVMIYALNENAHKEFNLLFREQQIRKTYHAIVSGRLFVQEGQVDIPLIESANGKMVASRSGKPSVTEFRVLEAFKTATLVELYPITGRTHQIRVHMKESGCPLLIDPIYGTSSEFYLSTIKRKKFNLQKDTEERPLISRLTLHCSALTWSTPDGTKTYDAPLLKDMKALLNQLNKWDRMS